MKEITIKVRDEIHKSTVEWFANLISYFCFTVAKEDICCNKGTKELCEKCEEPECEQARGWLKE